MKKTLIIIVASLLVVGGLVAAIVLNPTQNTNQAVAPDAEMMEPEADDTPEIADAPEAPQTPAAPAEEAPTEETATLSAGRYQDYSQASRSDQGYQETILFFHAAWCPECRAFEQAILASNIPEGVQVLKVDYDSSIDLRQQYGVTIQSTFVRVDSDGNKVSSWVGYGRDKSLAIVRENT